MTFTQTGDFATNFAKVESVYSNQKFKKPRFIILPKQKSKKTGLCKIYLEMEATLKTDKGSVRKIKRIDTLQSCFPNDWSTAKERIKPNALAANPTVNHNLDILAGKVDAYLMAMRSSPYSVGLPNDIKEFEKSFELKNRTTLIEWLDKYIEIRINDSGRNTWKAFRTLKGRLQFYEQHKNKTLFFEDITIEFADDLKSVLFKFKNLDPNTVQSTIEDLKTFVTYYHEDQHKLGIRINSDFLSKKFKKVSGTHDSDPSPLYQDDLEKVINYKVKKELQYSVVENGKELTKNITVDAVDRIKKLFLIGCFTGLRFSDIMTITTAKVKSNRLEVRTAKTNTPVYLPLTDHLNKILKEINYDVTKIKLSNQKANKYLTALLKDAGVNQATVEYKYHSNGDRTETTVPFYEVITFHSSRDTFITNMLIAGIDHISVMGWSGHTNFKTFRKYVKLSDAYLALNSSKANKFFNTFKNS